MLAEKLSWGFRLFSTYAILLSSRKSTFQDSMTGFKPIKKNSQADLV